MAIIGIRYCVLFIVIGYKLNDSMNKIRIGFLLISTITIGSITTTRAFNDQKVCIREYDVQRIENPKDDVKIPVKSKKIHFVRHAQGFHNVAGETDPVFGYLRDDLEDAVLTELGKQQCHNLHTSLDGQFFKNINLILVSPMRRTIETALYSFPNQVKDKRITFLANELIREQTGLHPCDRRRTIGLQKNDFPRIDFSKIESDKDPIYKLYTFREPETICAERGRKFIEYLFTLDEQEIVVVTHSAWLRHLFKYVLKTNSHITDGRFNNCEMKTFIISEKN